MASGQRPEEALIQILERFRPRPAEAYLCLSRRQAFVKFARLPSKETDEIRVMARMELLRQVPYEEDEISEGVRVLSESPAGYVEAMAVSAKREMLLGWSKILSVGGLRTEDTLFATEALWQWFVAVYPEWTSKTFLWVIAAEDYFEFMVLDHGRPVLSRVADFAPERITAAAAEQIGLSLQAYEKLSGDRLGQMLETGLKGRVDLEGLARAAHVSVHSIDPGRGFPEKAASFVAAEPGALALAASAHMKDRCQARLLPPEVRKQKTRMLYVAEVARAAAWAGVLLVLMLAVRLEFEGIQRSIVRRMDAELGQLSPKASVLEKIERRLRHSADEGAAAADIVKLLYEIAPTGAHLSSLDYKAGESLRINGRASSMSDVFLFSKTLAQSKLAGKPNIRHATRRSEQSDAFVDFEIECRYDQTGKSEHD